MHIRSLFLASCAFSLAAWPAVAPARTASVDQAQGQAQVNGSLRALAAQVTIPYTRFQLANGLTVLVHTDHIAPEISVSVWYDVGSKHEPNGRSGFAHLFEHLMFNGTENVPGDFFKPLEEAGATNLNGTTSNDRTNYYETVPTAALDRALFMESDRMGHLLGAVSQSALDVQRGVVQNEKRQGDDSPYSIVTDQVTTTLYPASHPYGHTVVGSMADLNAATLGDVRAWFRSHYGPNNALLVLAGDIDVATARPLVEKYFGDIPRGPANIRPATPIPTLAARRDEHVTAPIIAPTIVRAWAVPGYDDTDSLGLDVLAGILAQIDHARLDQILVRERKLFENISASNATLAQGGTFQIRGEVARGVDPVVAGRALDDALAAFRATSPSTDEIQRWATGFVVNYARGLESLSVRGDALAQGMLFTGNPDAYHRDLEYFTSLTPAKVQAVARKWLARPPYALTVLPGQRMTVASAARSAVQAPVEEAALPARQTRMAMPPVGVPEGVHFPSVTHARLSNGIEIVYARKASLPFTQLSLVLPAGSVVDGAKQHGLQTMMMAALDKGVPGRDSASIEAEKERLGAVLSGGAAVDESSIYLSTPSVNLAPALALAGQIIKQPTFPEKELEKLRRDTLTRLDQRRISPMSLVQETLPKLMDAHSPYAEHGALGDPDAVAALTRAEVIAAHHTWLRPEGTKLFVVSDLPLTELQPALQREFGDWKVSGPAPVIPGREAPAPATPQIVLINRPGSAQATISGGQVLNVPDREEMIPLILANQALGDGFLSRINMNLREGKHWSYGASGSFAAQLQEVTYTADTSVQQDQVGPAIIELRKEVSDFVTTRPMTQGELDFVRGKALRSVSSLFNSAGAVLSSMQENARRGRPDDYYSHIGERFQALTLDQLRNVMRTTLTPKTWIWVVVGDAAVIRPQLAPLGLPVRVLETSDIFPLDARAKTAKPLRAEDGPGGK